MGEYARKIANPTRFFIRGEWVDAASDAFTHVKSLSAEHHTSGSHIGSDHMVCGFVAGNSNLDRPEGALRLPKGSESDGSHDRIAETLLGLPSVPVGYGMAGPDTKRNSRGLASDLARARGCTGQREPIAAYRTELLCRLLEPICPAAWGGRPVLWPLWADEMVHRTHVMVHLVASLMPKLSLELDAPVRCELDYEVANNLAAAIRELMIVNDNERLPCSAILRGIARNLVELFGPVAGNITIATRIEPLELAAFKRRALVLVAVELLSDALINAFRGLDEGHIEVQLARISRSRARLVVKNSGSNPPVSVSHGCQPIGHDLASLLEAEIIYGFPGFDGAAAQIDFRI
jgi:hypothetical protein